MLPFDLNKRRAVNSPVDNFAERCLSLLICINQVLVGFQLVIREWLCSLRFEEFAISFLQFFRLARSPCEMASQSLSLNCIDDAVLVSSPIRAVGSELREAHHLYG